MREDDILQQQFTMLHQMLMERLEHHRDLPDEEIRDLIDHLLTEEAHTRHIRLSARLALRDMLFNAVRRLDILQEILDDDSITELMVNGCRGGIFIEREGQLMRWYRSFSDQEKLEDLVQQIVAYSNRSANEANAIVDAHLEGGARVSVVMPPVAADGPIITIRRFPNHPIDISQLIGWGSVSAEAADFLEKMVISRYNIFISGGTGSGKTTFLNALSSFIPKDERIITIEDNLELQIQGVENLVRLEARRPNEEGRGEVTIRDLVKASLRMRPDRIIVGEVRGPELVELVTGALNSGHDGSLSTGHGNSSRDMLSRMETMFSMAGLGFPVMAIRKQIASGIDLMVHLGRLRDKSRRVLEISEIDGYDYQSGEIMMHSLYEFRETGSDSRGLIIGELVRTGELVNTQKLERAGLAAAPGSV